MSNKANALKNLLPKLRFPEFQDTPKWSEKQLEDALSPTVRQIKKPINPYTGLGLRSHGKGTFLKNLQLPEKNAMEYLYEVQRDDLIVNITFAWEGAIAIARQTDAGALVSHRFPTYTFNRNVAIPEFFRYIILDKRFIYNLGVISPGGAGRNRVLNKNDFLKLTVSIPDIPEQQKIADCLTSIDDLIAAHAQKLDALKSHKKGVMQGLFPAAGESLPRLRFSEFQDVGEWESAPLREVYSFKVTNSFSRDQLNHTNGSVKNIHYGDIHTKFSTLFDISKETVPYINSSQSIEKIKQECYCVEGDMVFADASEDLNDVGKSIEIVNLNNEKLVSGLHTLLARQITPKLAIGFGGHLFKSDRIRTQIKKEAQGAKVLGISSGRLSNIEICFPSNKKEQQKIADCLSALDEQIAAQSQKLEALKSHKKGLMQGLFPSIEEVQG